MQKGLTVIQASRALGISLDALYRLIYAAKIDARKSEERWLIPSAAIQKRLRERRGRGRSTAPRRTLAVE